MLGDTYATVASGISNAFNADTNIQSIGLSSTAPSQTVTAAPTFPTYTGSTSGGATETLTSGQTYEGQGSLGRSDKWNTISFDISKTGIVLFKQQCETMPFREENIAAVNQGIDIRMS